MNKSTPKSGITKPRDDIDAEQVYKLAQRQWTLTEIGAFYNCDHKTISNRFSQEYAKGKESGRAKLRDMQFKSALKGNVTMQIWLGKQYLGQRDKSEVIGDAATRIVIVRNEKKQENGGTQNNTNGTPGRSILLSN